MSVICPLSGQSGRHVLVLSLSAFDPQETLGVEAKALALRAVSWIDPASRQPQRSSNLSAERSEPVRRRDFITLVGGAARARTKLSVNNRGENKREDR
jgi:hypothetical protein